MFEVIAAIIAAVGALISAIYGATSRQRAKEMDKLEKKLGAVESDFWTAFRTLPESHPTRREWSMLTRQFEDLQSDIRDLRDRLAKDTERILNAIRDRK